MARLGLQGIGRLRDDTVAGLRLLFSLDNPTPPERLLQRTEAELHAELAATIVEIDNQFMFAVLAEIEALLREDFKARRGGKSPDPLSVAFRKAARSRGEKIRLDEDLLESWKVYHPEFSPLVSDLRTAFKLRHWIAHGQHYHAKVGRKHDYLQVEALGYSVQQMVST